MSDMQHSLCSFDCIEVLPILSICRVRFNFRRNGKHRNYQCFAMRRLEREVSPLIYLPGFPVITTLKERSETQIHVNDINI